MELRTELCQRLFDIACAADPYGNPRVADRPLLRIRLEWCLEIQLALADEVIRQMEWARRKRRPLHSQPDSNSEIIGWTDLTLAPPDWKPS